MPAADDATAAEADLAHTRVDAGVAEGTVAADVGRRTGGGVAADLGAAAGVAGRRDAAAGQSSAAAVRRVTAAFAGRRAPGGLARTRTVLRSMRRQRRWWPAAAQAVRREAGLRGRSGSHGEGGRDPP